MEYLEFSKYRDSQAFQEAMRIKELETVIKICDELKGLDARISPFLYFKKAQALLGLGKKEEGLKLLQIAQEVFTENYGATEHLQTWSKEVSELYLKILIEQAKHNSTNPYKNLWLYNEAYQLTKEPELRYDLKQKRYQAYSDLVHDSSVPLKRFVYLEEDLPLQESLWITPLLVQNTGNVKFVGGVVRKGSFWIAHPYRKRVYYHFAEAEQLLFNDYLQEFIQLIQHLGAKEVTIEYLHQRHPEINLDPAAEKLPDDTSNTVRKVQNTIVTHHFNPTQKAHIPTHLTWLAHEPKWQNLVAQRTQGSLTQYEEIFDSKGLLQLSDIELEEVEEELSEMIAFFQYTTKTDASKKIRRNKRPLRNEEISMPLLKTSAHSLECKVKVLFAPLEELHQEVIYREIPTVEIELPKHTSESRKMQAVDVSKVVQETIEKIEQISENQPITPQQARLSTSAEEETAYDKWKKMVAESKGQEQFQESNPYEKELSKKRREEPQGEIEVEEVKISEKLQQTTNDEERDSDGFTRDERFYYEMLQHAYQDGYISEDVRKVLERRRQRFKISEERAAEIERIMLSRK